MTTKYRYTMRFTPEKMLALIEAATGRKPDGMGRSGLHTLSFDFNDTDINASQRQAALNTLPEWVRHMYSFDRAVVTDEEG